MFFLGTAMLIFGMSFFTVGSSISMEPLGDGLGRTLGKTKKVIIPFLICFVLGFFITISEPDLQVLAEQVPTIPNLMLIVCVGIGVGVFLCISFVRNKRELLCILAPTKISGDIMNVINESFGITSPANGIVFALPTEKAYKI